MRQKSTQSKVQCKQRIFNRKNQHKILPQRKKKEKKNLLLQQRPISYTESIALMSDKCDIKRKKKSKHVVYTTFCFPKPHWPRNSKSQVLLPGRKVQHSRSAHTLFQVTILTQIRAKAPKKQNSCWLEGKKPLHEDGRLFSTTFTTAPTPRWPKQAATSLKAFCPRNKPGVSKTAVTHSSQTPNRPEVTLSKGL